MEFGGFLICEVGSMSVLTFQRLAKISFACAMVLCIFFLLGWIENIFHWTQYLPRLPGWLVNGIGLVFALTSLIGFVCGAIPWMLGGTRIGFVSTLFSLIGLIGSGCGLWVVFMLYGLSHMRS